MTAPDDLQGFIPVTPLAGRPCVRVAVVMRRERIDHKWQTWRWVLAEVVPHEEAFGAQARLLFQGDKEERWLHPGFDVELFRDDAEGYYLNMTTDTPGWFVLWRMDEDLTPGAGDEPLARPAMVSLSYHDAGRWLDAQENVDQVPAPPNVIEWTRAFVDANYVQEPKKRNRPQSFMALQDRFGKPASVSTEKKFGGGGGHG